MPEHDDGEEETYPQPNLGGWSWPSSRNIVSREELRSSLEQYSRQPFNDVLEALLQARPSTERLLQFASESPDKWANTIKIFAVLGGYTEKTESLHVHSHQHIHQASDAELLMMMQEMMKKDPALLQDLRDTDAALRDTKVNDTNDTNINDTNTNEIEPVQNLNVPLANKKKGG